MNAPTTNPESSNKDNDEGQANKAKFEILVIGAGIAGLSFIYALKQSQVFKDGLIGFRVIEKRKGPGVDLGYPIHLSSSSRQTLETLLKPPDLQGLHDSQKKIPVYHDGITVSSYSGKQVWRMIRDSGVRPMIERRELVDILLDGAGGEMKVEYGKDVVMMRNIGGTAGREGTDGVEGTEGTEGGEGRKVEVELSDAEVMRVDLVVGADGMFSSTRAQLLSLSSQQESNPKSKTKDTDDLEKLPWTTINFRTTSSRVLRWVKDPNGINSIYGDSFSATMIPVGSGNESDSNTDRKVTDVKRDDTEVIKSIPHDKDKVESDELINEVQDHDQDRNDNQGINDDTVSNTETDANPQPNTPQSVNNDGNKDLDDPTMTQNQSETSKSSVYIALTVPSKWLEPQFCSKISKCTCEPTIHSLFLRDLENSDGWSGRKPFQLYSLKKTCTGLGRVVLLGDAAHGTVPFCGSGAGSAVVNASELVGVLERVIGAGEDEQLRIYRESSEKRNNALIKESKKLLWLIQGSSEFSRLSRKIIFWGLEMKERFGGERDGLEEELRERIDRANEHE